MELVFIHGWGFDASVWDGVAKCLPQYKQRRVDLGFFGKPVDTQTPGILIGHSLGFTYGMRQRQDWAGWIAINSFPRFVQTADKLGCVPLAVLREMRARFIKDPLQTLKGFYGLIGAQPVAGQPDVERLSQGLDELRDDHDDDLALNGKGLVLASRHDPLVPPDTTEVLGKQAEQVLFREPGGHMLHLTDPEWCAKAIDAFVRMVLV